MKLAIFSRYSQSQASTRVRFTQFVPAFSEAGFEVEIFPILEDASIGGKNKLASLWSRARSFGRVAKRLFKEPEAHTHVYIELLPWLPYSIERGLMRAAGRKRYSIEMDDAWFHRYDSHSSPIVRFVLGDKIDKLMRDAEFVVAGNQYIADRATLAGAKQVDVIPTVVRMEKYAAAMPAPKVAPHRDSASVVIGWIGTPATTKFLLHIESVIRELTRDKVAEFVAVN
jgi:hypothetical protein